MHWPHKELKCKLVTNLTRSFRTISFVPSDKRFVSLTQRSPSRPDLRPKLTLFAMSTHALEVLKHSKASFALECFTSGMAVHMAYKIRFGCEGFVAHRAFVLHFSCMFATVSVQISLSTEHLITLCALMSIVMDVFTMSKKFVPTREDHWTLITLQRNSIFSIRGLQVMELILVVFSKLI